MAFKVVGAESRRRWILSKMTTDKSSDLQTEKISGNTFNLQISLYVTASGIACTSSPSKAVNAYE